MLPLIKLKHVVQDRVKVELEAASALPLEHRLGDHRLDLSDARVPAIALHFALKLHQDNPGVVVLVDQLPVLLPPLQTLLDLKVVDEVLEVAERRSHRQNLS